MPGETKRCGHCREEKPAEHFYRDVSSPDGREWQCRSCRVAHPSSGPKGIKQDPLRTARTRPAPRCRRCNMRLLGVGAREEDSRVLELSCVYCGEFYYWRDGG